MGNKSQVAIIDYGMGNLNSVQRACEVVGLSSKITSDKEEIINSSAIILPGVGAFNDAMTNLGQLDLISPINDFVASGKLFLGICLGMQLVMTESEEFGVRKGLDLVQGSVCKFPLSDSKNQTIRVPQMNWNRIYVHQSNGNGLLQNIDDGEYMYFMHSYYVKHEQNSFVRCTTEYGGVNYCSGIKKDNLYAFQFHPEKSGAKGLEIYRNFKKLIA